MNDFWQMNSNFGIDGFYQFDDVTSFNCERVLSKTNRMEQIE
ncbi:hypothetical protein [Sporolactobacillus putidus]|nr:hypothetical protein [Sporolactobacillus putidus]